MKNTVLTIIIMFLSLAYADKSCCDKQTQPRQQNFTNAQDLLNAMAKTGEKLNSFSADITYSLTEDPDIFETKMTYTGSFKYLKSKKRQYAMIEFLTKQEDDFPLEKSRQSYIFDGVWLTRIDYNLKQVSRDQLADEENPEDVFKLIADDFPLMGFSEVDTLSSAYEIQFKDFKESLYELSLSPKKDSQKDAKYSSIRFTIDKKSLIPATIRSVSAQNNSIYYIELENPVRNEKIDQKIFNPKLSDEFTESVKTLNE